MAEPTPETRLALIEDRLTMGGAAFAELRGGVRKLMWFGVGLVTAALSMAFAAGQFVTGVEETRKAQSETSSQVDQVKASVSAIEREQVSIRSAVEAIAAGQRRLENKLDADPVTGRRKPR